MRRVLAAVALALFVSLLGIGSAEAEPSALTASFPRTATVSAGAKPAAVTGNVTGTPGRAVWLQTQAGQGWVTLATTVSDSHGGYALSTPTWWVGHQVLRTYAPATSEYAAATSAATGNVTVKRTYTPRGGTAYRNLAGPARWDPCVAISYRVNPSQMPAGALGDVKEAVRRVSEASGLRFVYAGTTSYVPYRKGSKQLATGDLTIAWAPPREVPKLAGNTLGLGGYGSGLDRGAWEQILDGFVVLDSTAKLPGGFATVARQSTRGSLLLHELGHAMGLDHVTDKRQVMYPLILPQAAQYASGDLRGLAAVGASQGCFPADVPTAPRARGASAPDLLRK
jgi:hypothetical protein